MCECILFFFDVIMLYQVSGIISFHNIQEKINEYK